MSYLLSDIIAFGCVFVAIGVPLLLFGYCLYQLGKVGWEIDKDRGLK